jgi:hypothetical protein
MYLLKYNNLNIEFKLIVFFPRKMVSEIVSKQKENLAMIIQRLSMTLKSPQIRIKRVMQDLRVKITEVNITRMLIMKTLKYKQDEIEEVEDYKKRIPLMYNFVDDFQCFAIQQHLLMVL